jgi:hypothetical protein
MLADKYADDPTLMNEIPIHITNSNNNVLSPRLNFYIAATYTVLGPGEWDVVSDIGDVITLVINGERIVLRE